MADPAPTGVHETVLYVDDVDAATAFYTQAVGLRVVFGPSEMFVGLRVAPGSVLLLFDPALSAAEGRDVPAHGAHGQGHVAFTVDDAALPAIVERCAQAGAGVERELTWPRGGRSVYVRDPAGNSVEFVVGEIWPD
ncbi:VOC family protein [Paraconexibacter sp.]|uniref:VOC family protein n=1 Tax=Paraconexibacter sp. TaxID=2949640 RepID=UPI003568B950